MDNRLSRMVAARYASAAEIERYHTRANTGLLDWEAHVLKTYHHSGRQVLDIGCGCGREAIALSKRGYGVTGIDISEKEIGIAQELARSLGLTIDYKPSGGEALDFEDASFDHVLMWSQVLGNVPTAATRRSLLQEAFRVLRPQGTLSLSVHNRLVCETIARKEGLIEYSHDFQLEDGDFIERAQVPSSGACYWHYFGRDELHELLRQVGFAVLACDVAPALGQNGPDRLGYGWDTLLIGVASKAA